MLTRSFFSIGWHVFLKHLLSLSY